MRDGMTIVPGGRAGFSPPATPKLIKEAAPFATRYSAARVAPLGVPPPARAWPRGAASRASAVRPVMIPKGRPGPCPGQAGDRSPDPVDLFGVMSTSEPIKLGSGA